MGTVVKEMTLQMKSSYQRLEYIDRLKGIAMLLVVIGHIIVFCGLGYENTFIRHITMMNMPLFYFLNGLVLKDTDGIKNGAKFLLSKSQQLLLPFFVWGGAYSLIPQLDIFRFHTELLEVRLLVSDRIIRIFDISCCIEHHWPIGK